MKAVSEWIWIIGGVMVGLAIFSFAYTNMIETNQVVIEQRSIEGFNEMKNIINNLCWSFSGNKRHYTLSLGESVEGIYAAKDRYEEYTKEQLMNKIISKERSEGEYICIKIQGKRLNCEKLDCKAVMPFMGSVPDEFSLSKLINRLTGTGSVSNYYLEFTRTPTNVTVDFSTAKT